MNYPELRMSQSDTEMQIDDGVEKVDEIEKNAHSKEGKSESGESDRETWRRREMEYEEGERRCLSAVQWIMSSVIPVPKSGDLSKMDNFRGISLTYIIPKMVN